MNAHQLLSLLFLAREIWFTDGQKLSKERMLEFFENTTATEKDIDNLIENVNSYSYPKNKRAAMVRWVYKTLAGDEDIDEYARNGSAFIASLTFAHRVSLWEMIPLAHSQKLYNKTAIAMYREQYCIDQELYGNDVTYAFLKNMVDFAHSVKTGKTPKGKGHTTKPVKPLPIENLFEKMEAADKVLFWPKLYKDRRWDDWASDKDKSFYLLINLQAEKYE